MTKIVHISDLHFGTEDSKIVNYFIDDMSDIKPNVVVVSGDLTQRAKTNEYIKAKDFLGRLEYQKVVIPGNHDIPLYQIWNRILNPFKKFDKYFDISDRYYSDNAIEIIGLNSVQNLRWKSGKLSLEQLESGVSEFKKSGKNTVRILVVHHNLFHISSKRDAVKLFKTKPIHRWLMQNKIDLVLFGHDHKSMIQPILFDDDNIFDFILVQAGTATSNRTRGYSNSFNIIEISDDKCEIKIKEYKHQKFGIISDRQFVKISAGWKDS